jgi:L-idonate 5-dehydrogenase
MSIHQEPIPIPNENQVRIKIAYAGVCGSDLHYYFEGANGAFVVKEPLIPGHELSGTIDLDPQNHWTIGTNVTVHPGRPGERLENLADKPHLWPRGSYLGSASTNPHTQGGMCDYLLVDRAMVRPLPKNLSLKNAALAEPLGVAIHSIKISGSVQDKDVLVSGSGPIGLLVAAACRVYGARSITCTDVVDGALTRAREVGATKTINVAHEKIPAESYDIAFECSGSPRAISASLVGIRRAGTVVQVGMLGAGDQPIEIAPLVAKEIRLLGTFRFNNEIDDAISMLAENPWIEKTITHTFTLEDSIRGFEVAKNSQESGKVLIQL